MMPAPIVDTFEHDIADEVRQKEASIADIASATGEISNAPKDTTTNHSSVLISIVTILVLCGILGLIFVGYLYYSGKFDPLAPTPQQTVESVKKKDAKPAIQTGTIFPSLDKAVGQYVKNVEKTSAGYNITITSYSPVFAFMIKNESSYVDELGQAVNPTQTAKIKDTPGQDSKTVTSTSTTISSTSTAQATGTITNEVPVEQVLEGVFSDVTINNQNMRVATSMFGKVVYAFIGNQNLVISSSTEGILSFRNNILHK